MNGNMSFLALSNRGGTTTSVAPFSDIAIFTVREHLPIQPEVLIGLFQTHRIRKGA